jgi:hypothetical protein
VIAFCRIYQRGRGTAAPVSMTARITDTHDAVVRRVVAALDAAVFEPARFADYRVPLSLAELKPGAYLLTLEASAGGRTIRRDVRFEVTK